MPLEIKRLHLASVTPPGTRAELDRARRESPGLPGLSVIATPGHTNGHQSVVIRGDGGDDLLIGDAAYTPQLYAGPDGQKLPMAHSRGGASRVRRAWRSIRARTRFSACSGLAGPAAPEAASQRPLIPQWRRCCTRAVQVSPVIRTHSCLQRLRVPGPLTTTVTCALLPAPSPFICTVRGLCKTRSHASIVAGQKLKGRGFCITL